MKVNQLEQEYCKSKWIYNILLLLDELFIELIRLLGGKNGIRVQI
jgi:hypothetical protein